MLSRHLCIDGVDRGLKRFSDKFRPVEEGTLATLVIEVKLRSSKHLHVHIYNIYSTRCDSKCQ